MDNIKYYLKRINIDYENLIEHGYLSPVVSAENENENEDFEGIYCICNTPLRRHYRIIKYLDENIYIGTECARGLDEFLIRCPNCKKTRSTYYVICKKCKDIEFINESIKNNKKIIPNYIKNLMSDIDKNYFVLANFFRSKFYLKFDLEDYNFSVNIYDKYNYTPIKGIYRILCREEDINLSIEKQEKIEKIYKIGIKIDSIDFYEWRKLIMPKILDNEYIINKIDKKTINYIEEGFLKKIINESNIDFYLKYQHLPYFINIYNNNLTIKEIYDTYKDISIVIEYLNAGVISNNNYCLNITNNCIYFDKILEYSIKNNISFLFLHDIKYLWNLYDKNDLYLGEFIKEITLDIYDLKINYKKSDIIMNILNFVPLYNVIRDFLIQNDYLEFTFDVLKQFIIYYKYIRNEDIIYFINVFGNEKIINYIKDGSSKNIINESNIDFYLKYQHLTDFVNNYNDNLTIKSLYNKYENILIVLEYLNADIIKNNEYCLNIINNCIYFKEILEYSIKNNISVFSLNDIKYLWILYDKNNLYLKEFIKEITLDIYDLKINYKKSDIIMNIPDSAPLYNIIRNFLIQNDYLELTFNNFRQFIINKYKHIYIKDIQNKDIIYFANIFGNKNIINLWEELNESEWSIKMNNFFNNQNLRYIDYKLLSEIPEKNKVYIIKYDNPCLVFKDGLICIKYEDIKPENYKKIIFILSFGTYTLYKNYKYGNLWFVKKIDVDFLEKINYKPLPKNINTIYIINDKHIIIKYIRERLTTKLALKFLEFEKRGNNEFIYVF